MKKYISIDIGGTAIKYGIVSEDAEVLLKKEMKTEAQKGGPAILDKVIGIVEALKEEADAGVCISTAGMVDIEKGEIFYSAPLIPNYIGTAFKKTVEERFGIPCEVENDVNCAGLAEYKAGAAAGSKAAVMLTIGTGIGGCILLNGEVFHGFSNSACEVGYMHIKILFFFGNIPSLDNSCDGRCIGTRSSDSLFFKCLYQCSFRKMCWRLGKMLFLFKIFKSKFRIFLYLVYDCISL